MQKAREFFPGLWAEFQEWFPKQKIRLADAVEHFLNKLRRVFASFMMVLSTAIPLPKWLYAKLTRDYFFSPRKVMGLKFKKNPELNKKIEAYGFRIKPGSKDNLDILHSFYLPARDEGKPTIVFSHGRDTNIGHLESLFEAADKEGYGFFAYDYPGFGKSDGTPSEELLKESGAAACRFLASDGYRGGYGIPYKDQILMGYSLGGGVATDVAKQFSNYIADLEAGRKNTLFNVANETRLKAQRPRGLILVNTFTSIPEAFKAKLAEQRKWIARSLDPERISIQFNSKEALKHVSMPVRVFSCENDSTIPHTLGKELAEAAGENGRYGTIEGKGHNINGGTLKEILGKLPPEDLGKQPGAISTVA